LGTNPPGKKKKLSCPEGSQLGRTPKRKGLLCDLGTAFKASRVRTDNNPSSEPPGGPKKDTIGGGKQLGTGREDRYQGGVKGENDKNWETNLPGGKSKG